MEVELVKEGLPIEEIQHLCNVHAEVFKATLEEIHHPDQVPGHPIYTFIKENEALTELRLTTYKGEKDEVIKKIEEVLHEVKEMIYKEEKILFPMCLDTLTEDEWIEIYNESDEISLSLLDFLL